MKESVLQEKIIAFYRKKDIQIFSEIPFMSRVIDLILLYKKTVITLELKIKKWKKAIEQMKEHRIASDYCYLCMPEDVRNNNLSCIIGELEHFGFGLYLWNDISNSLELIHIAKKNVLTNKLNKDRLLNTVEVLNAKNKTFS